MELRFTLAEDDVIDAHRVLPGRVWNKFLALLLLMLLGVVGAALIEYGFAVAGWLWLAISVGIGIAMYEVPRTQMRRTIRRNPSLQGELHYVFSIDEGITCVFPTGSSQVEWRAYTGYKETANSFLVFLSSTSRYTLIPKRIMSAEQVANFRGMLRTKLPKSHGTNAT